MSVNAAKKRKPWKWVLLGVLIVVLGVVGVAAYQGIGAYNSLNQMQKPQDKSFFKNVEDTSAPKPPEWTGKERVNIMLLGGDARGVQEGQVARSDSMLIASIDPVTKKAHLFSILRDTYVEIPGHGRNRINTAITLGGPDLAMKTAGDLLGLDIQYYVYADFEGFKALIDSIGGIDFDVEKDMHYTDNADKNRYDINLKKGFQHLDGTKALEYVRFRHDAMSDFTRTERQRNFLKAVAKELQSTWNLIRMKQILDSVQPYIETNLDVSDMLKLGQLGLGVHVAGSVQVPPMDLIADEKVGGAAVIAVQDEDKLREYVQESLNKDDTAASVTPGDAATTPVDGGSTSDQSASDPSTSNQSSSDQSASAVPAN